MHGPWTLPRMRGYHAGMARTRAVFMGTPEFCVPVLTAVERLGWEVVAVYTAHAQPSGRGRRMETTPVYQYAAAHDYPVLTPESVRAEAEVARLGAMGPDVVVLAAYGKILPSAWLSTPRRGCLNVHPSLLPRHRGAAPVAATILAGDQHTGATLFAMDQGVDSGPVVAQERVELRGDERAGELTARLFALGAELLVRHGQAYVDLRLLPRPQPAEGATVSRRLTKEMGTLEWSEPAVQLERQVRAYDPWPGAATLFEGKRLAVVEAGVAPGDGGGAPAGTVVVLEGGGVGVTAGRSGGGADVLVLRRVQLEGRPVMTAAEFVRGRPRFVGARLPG